jgi:pimeloyl-ACP methyl ester carboxylesterase
MANGQSMIARLQQAWVLVLATSALAATAWALEAGQPWWRAVALGLAVVHIHALVLALEFVALSRVDPGAGLPRPSCDTLVRAWWGEVWTGFRVFCWRQPFRADAIADSVRQAKPIPGQGVLLVHGFVCNRGLWNPWMERLEERGVPFVAVNLEPAFGSIDQYVSTIEAGIRRLETLGYARPLVVAHSMGGLAVRAWLRACQGDQRVHSVITIGSPHAGTALARFGFSRNTRQMRRGGPWLSALGASESPQRRALFTCYYGHCDNIVVPASTATLVGADNRHIAGVAHVHLAFQPQIIDDVIARVGGATHRPETGASGPASRI